MPREILSYDISRWEQPDPAYSDGCPLILLLPVWLRSRFQVEAAEIISRGKAQQIAMNVARLMHDKWYYYGGTESDRKEADLVLRLTWKVCGSPRWFYTLGYLMVRWFGGPSRCIEDVSWAYGDSFFEYGESAQSLDENGPSGQAQTPKPPLCGHDLWPFNEERCNCDDNVVCSILTLNNKPYGMICEGCGTEYTERTI